MQYVISEDDGQFGVAKVTDECAKKLAGALIWCEALCDLAEVYSKMQNYCIAAMDNKYGKEKLNKAALNELEAIMETIEALDVADVDDLEEDGSKLRVNENFYFDYSVDDIESKI